MTQDLEPIDRDPRLPDLERRLEDRERELGLVKNELLQLQSRYFSDVGALYDELGALDREVAEIEIGLGLRPPPDGRADDDDLDEPSDADAALVSGCSTRSAPSPDLKRVFRDLAKAIHPDRAADGAERFRRHSLMAEANRAYAERDEDRLRLILRAWERHPGLTLDRDPDAARWRARRRVAEIEERLIAIDVEFADLRTSAIWRLKARIEEARAQGWDLLAEIVAEVKRQIARSSARLAALRRQVTARGGEARARH
jgi:hypothetical protein